MQVIWEGQCILAVLGEMLVTIKPPYFPLQSVNINTVKSCGIGCFSILKFGFPNLTMLNLCRLSHGRKEGG